MSNRTDSITRDELIRAIQAVRRSLPERATGAEALDGLADEIETPHTCKPAYMQGNEGPCEKCWEWVPA